MYHQTSNSAEPVPAGHETWILGHPTHRKNVKHVHHAPGIVSKCQCAHKGAKGSYYQESVDEGEIKKITFLMTCSYREDTKLHGTTWS